MNRMTLAIAFGCLALSLPAQAQPFNSLVRTSSLSVSYADLDVQNEAGAHTLLARLKTAATQVCAPAPEPRDLALSGQFEACFTSAMDDAVAQVPSHTLSRLYAGEPVDARKNVAARQ